MAALTLIEVKNHLKVDFDTDDTKIACLMIVADNYMKGSVGETYDTADESSKELLLKVITDLYDNRGISGKAGTNERRLFDDMELQMRLGLRVDV